MKEFHSKDPKALTRDERIAEVDKMFDVNPSNSMTPS